MGNIPQTRAKTKRWVAFVAIVGFNNLALFYVRVSDPLELQTVMSCPCGCWDSNLGPLEEWPMLLTTEPSLQPQDV